jgi:hypothetical protein
VLKRRFCRGMAQTMGLLLVLACAGGLSAQPKAAKSASASAAGAAPAAAPVSSEDLEGTREQLFKLLRVSPSLTQVIQVDPSLLADSEYVGRTNPELAQFLQSHPQIVRSPEFYLFGEVGRGQRFERRVWPEVNERNDFSWSRVEGDLIPFLVFIFILGAVLWVLRAVLEHWRWGRLFRAQTDVYNKLLERFSSNEELLAYMRSDAGKRSLESALPLAMESRSQFSSPIARVLTPLQIGVVMALAGLGFLYLRNDFKDTAALLVFGTMGLMLGLGFIISAGLSWALARHLGLMPSNPPAQAGNGTGLNGRDQT